MVAMIRARVLQAVVSLVGVTLVAFLLANLTGNVTDSVLPDDATAEQRAAFMAAHGLDRPLLVQYGDYVTDVVRGDFGRSWTHGRPAMQVVLDRMPATILLAVTAMALSLLIAIPLGVGSALRRNSLLDKFAMGFVLLNQAIPAFWLGLILMLIFAVQFGVLPVAGSGTWQHLVLPSITMASWLMALITRLVRSSMLEVLNSDYMRTAAAKGLHPFVIITRHGLRNALVPMITVVGLQLGALFGGAVVTESVFSWPGVGGLVYQSILSNDIPVIMSSLVVVASSYVLINLTVDIIVGLLDPQTR